MLAGALIFLMLFFVCIQDGYDLSDNILLIIFIAIIYGAFKDNNSEDLYTGY